MVQVMLVHSQIPNLPIQKLPKDLSTLDEVNFQVLEECTLQQQVKTLIEQKSLLQVVMQVIEFISQLRDAFFFEFELASHNLVVIPPTDKVKAWGFTMVNQAIPFAYRSDFFIEVNQIYNESEYEFNEALILKKVASFFVTLATGKEPEN